MKNKRTIEKNRILKELLETALALRKHGLISIRDVAKLSRTVKKVG
jgi:predicted transcriptional regulator of viral defense system